MVSEHASPLATLGGEDAGGQNVHVAALAEALAGRGHEVTVFTRRDSPGLPRTVRTRGFTVEHVDAGPAEPVSKDELMPYMPYFAEFLAQRWTEDLPDIVHGHFWMSGWAALSGTARPGVPDVPVVQTFHALGVVKRRHQGGADNSPPARRRLESLVARRAHTVIATCTSEADDLRALGVHPFRLEIVPCGVDLRLFRPDGPAAGRNGRFRVLSVSRLVRRKGLDTVLEAMARLPEAELLVAGGPARRDLDRDPEIARWRAVAERHGISDRVVFLGGVPHEEVPALMRSADVVVGVPWYEPFGMVPVEAMACGTPVVASAVGGHLDTVVDGTTGLLVPPRDPRALAGALRRVLDAPGWCRTLATAAVRRAHSLYSWEQVAQGTEAVYTKVADRAAVPMGEARS
ncbi:glycosyltransferase [Actinocorallia aurantiaca]